MRHGEKRFVVFIPANAGRLVPATDRIYHAVMTGQITHDGDTVLASHVAHCVAKSTPQGDLVTKDKRGSPRKIDAAVAAIVAFDRAAHHANKNPKRRAVAFR
jgi:phage terminase large subunit-like protein